MRMLGIDYGTKRIGIALSDSEGAMAFPHSVLENTPDVIECIARIVEERDVKTIVIGESRNYKGEKNPLMKDIVHFKAGIEKRMPVTVHFELETLTTAEAKRIPHASDMPRSRKRMKRKMVDASAAALILQSYLDRTKFAIAH